MLYNGTMKFKKSKLEVKEQQKAVAESDVIVKTAFVKKKPVQLTKEQRLAIQAKQEKADKAKATVAKIGKFIGNALMIIFLLSVIFSMIAIPLLIVFG